MVLQALRSELPEKMGCPELPTWFPYISMVSLEGVSLSHDGRDYVGETLPLKENNKQITMFSGPFDRLLSNSAGKPNDKSSLGSHVHGWVFTISTHEITV